MTYVCTSKKVSKLRGIFLMKISASSKMVNPLLQTILANLFII